MNNNYEHIVEEKEISDVSLVNNNNKKNKNKKQKLKKTSQID